VKGFTILFGLLTLALLLSGCGAGKVFAAQEPSLMPKCAAQSTGLLGSGVTFRLTLKIAVAFF
jgi:hypothetical protein